VRCGRVLWACAVEQGVLRQGVDRFSIERIARDLLTTFQSTLASADNAWENQMSDAEKKAARRARRARIGQDLFATQADKPFVLPPKWTCVPTLTLTLTLTRQALRVAA
jgi:hypothetical protein